MVVWKGGCGREVLRRTGRLDRVRLYRPLQLNLALPSTHHRIRDTPVLASRLNLHDLKL